MEWGKLGCRYASDGFHTGRNYGFCNYHLQLKFSYM